MQLPVMEDYMQGKSIQDDKKKFIAEMQCNKEADQNKLWMRARDRVDGMRMVCVMASWSV